MTFLVDTPQNENHDTETTRKEDEERDPLQQIQQPFTGMREVELDTPVVELKHPATAGVGDAVLPVEFPCADLIECRLFG